MSDVSAVSHLGGGSMGGPSTGKWAEAEMVPSRTVSRTELCPHLCPQQRKLVGTFAISDASDNLDEMSHDPAQEAGFQAISGISLGFPSRPSSNYETEGHRFESCLARRSFPCISPLSDS